MPSDREAMDSPTPGAEAPSLRQLASEANVVLMSIKTVFPFTLFPNEITIDMQKVSVVKKGLLKLQRVITLKYDDIMSVEADTGPLLGALTLTSGFFTPNKPLMINYLIKEDAIKARRLINGLLIARKNETKLEIDDLAKTRERLIKLGEAHE